MDLVSILIVVATALGMAAGIFGAVLFSMRKVFADLKNENAEWQKKYSKLLHQKKSSEVRVGKIGENMAPFLEDWPYDPNSFRFLGNPIDGIQFADDKIRFVEIKTGKARLSASQKWIRDLVKKGKVSFVSFRIGEDGCSVIEEDILDVHAQDTIIKTKP